jgi:transposase
MKQKTIEVKESLVELTELLAKYKDYRYRRRIKSLIYLINGSNFNRAEISSHLEVDRKTLYQWYSCYENKGLSGLLSSRRKVRKSRLITSDLHDMLKKKVHDSSNPFLGYQDAVEWVYHTCGITINYHTLRGYLKKHFNTTLKTPRKSHYKKSTEEVEAYKKTSICARTS